MISMSSFLFAEWPPVLNEAQLEALTLYASTYALSHGLLYLPATAPQPPAPTSAIHAPLSIFPSPLPRRLFDLARRLQKGYNVLYSRIAMDEAFLDHVMGEVEGVGKVDDFVGTMWRGWKRLRDEKNGLLQVSNISRIYLNALTIESSASSTRTVSFRLSVACALGEYTNIIETSRIQYHLLLLRPAIRTQRRSSQVSLSSRV